MALNTQLLTNRVFNTDVAELLRRMDDESVDTIFADPDYNVGVRYNNRSFTKVFDEYIDWLVTLSSEFRRVLKPTGNLFIVNYPKNNSYLRVKYLDNHFHDVNEYVWVYNTNVGHHSRHFTTAHRTILHCTKSKENQFFKDHVAQPYKNPTDKRIRHNLATGSKGRMPYSWVYYNLVKNVSRQKTFHSCQIPEQLSELLIKASTKEEDVVFIPFGGSGAEIAVCLRTNRRFISAEIDKAYYQVILNRIENEGAVNWSDRLLYQIRKKQQPAGGPSGEPIAAGQLHLIRESATRSRVEVSH